MRRDVEDIALAPVYRLKSQRLASSAFVTRVSGVDLIIFNTSSAMQADFCFLYKEFFAIF